jgi:hypothetical protein
MIDSLDDAHERTPSERRNGRRYLAEFIVGVLTYMILVPVSVSNVEHVTGWLKYIVAIAPTFGASIMVVAMVRFVLTMDELQRQTFVVAGAITLLVTLVVTLAIGFLENAGIPHVNMTFVWPIAVVSWAIAMPFVRRRYL